MVRATIAFTGESASAPNEFGTRKFAQRRGWSMAKVACCAMLLAGCVDPRAPDHASNPTCIRFWPEARYRNYGYDHVVHLQSECQVQAVCDVSTDVNPSQVVVRLPAGAHVEVLTMRGSPAREFRPQVACRLVRRG